MKITLVQAEIEDAIKQYLGGQMTIAKGMAITIELKATRGDDGYMALVDIRKIANWVPPMVEHSTLEPDTEVVVETPKVTVPAHIPKPEVVKAAAKAHVEEEVESAENEAIEAETEEAVVEAETDQAEEALPEVAPVVQATVVEKAAEGKPARAGGRSLFGGLKKPTN